MEAHPCRSDDAVQVIAPGATARDRCAVASPSLRRGIPTHPRLPIRVPIFYFSAPGQVSEWLKEPVSKTGIPARVSRVRIPPCPLRALARASHQSSVVSRQQLRRTSGIALPTPGASPRRLSAHRVLHRTAAATRHSLRAHVPGPGRSVPGCRRPPLLPESCSPLTGPKPWTGAGS